jgi:hypothetical protein
MNAPLIALRQGLRLLQISAALLLFTSLLGFAIPYVAAPHSQRINSAGCRAFC